MPRQAKNSTAVTTIPAAIKTKNLTVFDRAHVTRIGVDANGRASGVTYLRGGKEYFQPAAVVLLASYTYENTRLLLLSKSKAFPKGLSNNHGQVGRHYFGHWVAAGNGGVIALFPFDLNVWYGTPAQGMVLDDWADDNYDHSGLGFIGGTNLHVYNEMHPIQSAGMETFGEPALGSRWKSFVHAKRRPLEYRASADFHLPIRRQFPRSGRHGARSPRRPGMPRSPRSPGRTNCAPSISRNERWRSGSWPRAPSKWSGGL